MHACMHVSVLKTEFFMCVYICKQTICTKYTLHTDISYLTSCNILAESACEILGEFSSDHMHAHYYNLQ